MFKFVLTSCIRSCPPSFHFFFSPLQDDFIVLHISGEYDSVLETVFKTEFLTLLSSKYQESMNRQLKVDITSRSDKFDSKYKLIEYSPPNDGHLLNPYGNHIKFPFKLSQDINVLTLSCWMRGETEHTAILINVAGLKLQAYMTRPNGRVGRTGGLLHMLK